MCGRVLALVGDYARELCQREAMQEKPVPAAPHESPSKPVLAPAMSEKALDATSTTNKDTASTLKRRTT